MSSIIRTANVYFDGTGSVRIGKDGSAIVITGGPLVFDEMNVSYGQANTARTHANAAYGEANSASAAASTADTKAVAAFGAANSAASAASTADTKAVAAYGQANTARNTANTADTVADAAYGQANSAASAASTADTKAVAAFGAANSAASAASTADTKAVAAFSKANSACTAAATADTKAVAAFAAANNVNNLSKADGNFIVGTGSAWTVESGATARTSMGAAATSAAQTFSGGVHSFNAQTSVAIETLASSQTQGLQVYQTTAGADAIMTFHVAGDFACHFGLDGGDNDFVVGGWSMGTTKYRVLHTGNYQGLIAGTNGYGTRTVSTSAPSGGSDGDIWLKV